MLSLLIADLRPTPSRLEICVNFADYGLAKARCSAAVTHLIRNDASACCPTIDLIVKVSQESGFRLRFSFVFRWAGSIRLPSRVDT